MPKAPVTVAELRNRITIESQVLANDGQGGKTETWVEFATVWAKIEPKSSREMYFAEQTKFTRTHVITIRYYAGVISSMRIKFDRYGGTPRYFQIHGVRQPDERRFFMLLDCEEGVGT